jgi:hypothetical protein
LRHRELDLAARPYSQFEYHTATADTTVLYVH